MIILILHILVSLSLLAAVLSVYLPASVLPIPAWFALMFEWLIAAELMLGLLQLFTKYRRWTWMTVAMIVLSIAPICYTVSHGSLFFPKSKLPHSFTLMTYNSHMMDASRKPKQNRVIQYILRTQPDVVCLQEVEVYKSGNKLSLNELREALNVYPYTYFDFKVYNSQLQFGNVVFSRYPLIGKHTLRYQSATNITSVCDIVLPTDTIRLYTNHLESNKLLQKDLDLGTTTEQAKSAFNSTSEKLAHASAIRIEQAKILRSDAERSPYPVLIVGDMNTTPVSYTYRILQRGLRDAFLESSDGQLGHTFIKKRFGVRIDYILHSKDLSASGLDVQHVDYSDHYPVLATIHY
jgi:endonuclease/exonuclease/phosphatase family metal-dependent hydrolase